VLWEIRKVGLIIFLLCLATIGLQAQSGMPDFVLKAAQNLNALYGSRFEVSNIYSWDYQGYSADQHNPREMCSSMDANAPAFPAGNDNYYIVSFETNSVGFSQSQTWRSIVYDDKSYVGPCFIPPLPTPVPTQGPTAIPPTQSNCGGLLPRLVIGQQGRVTPGDPNNIREDHGVSTRLLGEIPAGGVFAVLDGPRCTDSGTWWRVDYNGLQGWTLEGNAGAYFTEPASFPTPTVPAAATVATKTPAPTFTPIPVLPTVAPTQIICLPAIPPRLRIGETARVTAGGIPNNVREQSGKSSKLIGEIPPLGVFTVLNGPVCTGDGAWWLVNYNGLQGWTLEGMEAEYWIEPILPNLQPVTLANVTRMRPLPTWSYAPLSSTDVTLESLSNDGTLIYSSDTFTQQSRPKDVFAPAETLAWDVITNPLSSQIILESDKWGFYDASGSLITQVTASSTSEITRFETSPDKSWGAVLQGTTLSIVNLSVQAAEAERVKTLTDVHGEAILAMGFSANSSTFVTISAHTIYAWDTMTWQPRLIHTLTTSDPVTAWPTDLVFAISASGQHLFVAPHSTEVGMVTALQGSFQARWAHIMLTQAQSAAFVRDEWIAIGGADTINNGLLVSLSISTLDPLILMSEPAVDIPNGFRSIVINPNGTMIATYNGNTQLRLWGVWQP
jgi:hypothetical protein